LCQNNPQFIQLGIQIDFESLAQLPENSNIPINEKVVENNEEGSEYDTGPEISEKN
jgi:hypothetical protein